MTAMDMDTEQGTFPPRPSPTPAMDIEQGTSPPRPTPATDTAAPELPLGCQICLYFIFGSTLLFVLGVLFWSMVEGIMYKEPHYSVAIAAVSGLDPAADLSRQPAQDLEFNLTVVVAPRSPLMHACAFPGTTARVSYHGLELASAAVPKFCETRGTRTVIARGRVWLSGPALGNLAADMRRAAGVFDVTISIPYTEGARKDMHVLVVSCMGRRVGEAVDGVPFCDARDVKEATSLLWTCRIYKV